MSETPAINWSKVGRYAVTAKVVSIEDNEKLDKLRWVQFEGINRKVNCWKNAEGRFAQKLAVGAEAEAVIEVKESKSGENTYLNPYLFSFGGDNKGGSPRGLPVSAPKTLDEIHSPAVAAIVCEAIRSSEHFAWSEPHIHSFVRVGVAAYMNGMETIRLGHTPPVPASEPAEPVMSEWEWFKSLGGTPEDAEFFKGHCARQGLDWRATLAKYREANYSTVERILSEVRPKELAGAHARTNGS